MPTSNTLTLMVSLTSLALACDRAKSSPRDRVLTPGRIYTQEYNIELNKNDSL